MKWGFKVKCFQQCLAAVSSLWHQPLLFALLSSGDGRGPPGVKYLPKCTSWSIGFHWNTLWRREKKVSWSCGQTRLPVLLDCPEWGPLCTDSHPPSNAEFAHVLPPDPLLSQWGFRIQAGTERVAGPQWGWRQRSAGADSSVGCGARWCAGSAEAPETQGRSRRWEQLGSRKWACILSSFFSWSGKTLSPVERWPSILRRRRVFMWVEQAPLQVSSGIFLGVCPVSSLGLKPSVCLVSPYMWHCMSVTYFWAKWQEDRQQAEERTEGNMEREGPCVWNCGDPVDWICPTLAPPLLGLAGPWELQPAAARQVGQPPGPRWAPGSAPSHGIPLPLPGSSPASSAAVASAAYKLREMVIPSQATMFLQKSKVSYVK